MNFLFFCFYVTTFQHPGRKSYNFVRMKWNEDPSLKKDVQKATNNNENGVEMPNDLQTKGFEVVCRPSPYNICYSVDAHGNVIPLKRKRPIRAIRVYF